MRRVRNKTQNSSYLVALLLVPLAAALPCACLAESNAAKSNKVVEAPDQRLMDAETALLQSLQARAMAKPLSVSLTGEIAAAAKDPSSKAAPLKSASSQ